jgi:hypothetical protein
MLRRFWRNLWAIVRELSDERAYARHLAHHGCTHSAREYRRFQTEHYGRKYRRARCC